MAITGVSCNFPTDNQACTQTIESMINKLNVKHVNNYLNERFAIFTTN